MHTKDPMLIGRIRSAEPMNSGGDIVIKTEMRDGKEYKKIFQRDAQSAPVRWIYRLVDKALGKQNLSALVADQFQATPQVAETHLKTLQKGLLNARKQLSESPFSKPVPKKELPFELALIENLTNVQTDSFKLAERLESGDFIKQLKANDCQFDGPTLRWLKQCHQDLVRGFTGAEVSRINTIVGDFHLRITRNSPSGMSESQTRLFRELFELHTRMGERMDGAKSAELKNALDLVFWPSAKYGEEINALLTEMATPDLPISLTCDDALCRALGQLHADWKNIKSNDNLRRELAPLILRAEQAYFSDKATTASLEKGVLKATAMRFLADEIRRLASEDKKKT